MTAERIVWELLQTQGVLIYGVAAMLCFWAGTFMLKDGFGLVLVGQVGVGLGAMLLGLCLEGGALWFILQTLKVAT